jgi:LmbE family N-acetylglucosaminyl deacetylase
MPYRLMCITAHPDDECGAFGGALLMAHAAGAETTVICLTEGQAASNRGDAASGVELAELRRGEFAAAGEVLGVSRGEVLLFPDGKLYRHDPTELIAVLVERIRQWRPQVVLTFGGEGGVNLHRDHTVVSMATTVAFHWAGRRSAFPEQLDRGMKPYWPQKLYYSATPFLMVRDEEEKTHTCLTPYSLTLELGADTEKKFEAFRKHTTQAGLLDKARQVWEPTWGQERYLLVAARGLTEVSADHSLLQGLIDD